MRYGIAISLVFLTFSVFAEERLPLGPEADVKLIVEKSKTEPDIALEYSFAYHMFREGTDFPDTVTQRVDAIEILVAPEFFHNQVQKRLAAAVVKDPCINDFGELKLDPFCQAAAKAAYFRQKINSFQPWFEAKPGYR